MTKTKQAISEVNKMADKELLKAKIDGYKKQAKEWLNVEVYGYSRKKIVIAVGVMAIILAEAF
jgi:hypothetical protein